MGFPTGCAKLLYLELKCKLLLELDHESQQGYRARRFNVTQQYIPGKINQAILLKLVLLNRVTK